MSDPWLAIPLEDYEGHMRSDAVGQLDALAQLFGQALLHCRPSSVAILGAAGGNGLDRVDSAVTRRVVAVDINPAYLETARQRYANLPELEVHCVDLAAETLHLPPVDLVHTALVFEHAGLGRCLENAVGLVGRGGALSVVLQLPSESQPGVSPSPYPSIQALAGHFSLVDPAAFCATLGERGFRLERQYLHPLGSGKTFWMGILRLS